MNAWNPLLRGTEDNIADFTGFEVNDFKKDLEEAGETGPTATDVEEWLGRDDGDPGYEILSTAEIADSVLRPQEEEEEDDEDDDTPPMSLAAARTAADDLLRFIDEKSRHLSHFYPTIRELRSFIISSQYQSLKQRKIDSFFQPRTPSSRSSTPAETPTSSPAPSTSGTTTFRRIFPESESDSE